MAIQLMMNRRIGSKYSSKSIWAWHDRPWSLLWSPTPTACLPHPLSQINSKKFQKQQRTLLEQSVYLSYQESSVPNKKRIQISIVFDIVIPDRPSPLVKSTLSPHRSLCWQTVRSTRSVCCLPGSFSKRQVITIVMASLEVLAGTLPAQKEDWLVDYSAKWRCLLINEFTLRYSLHITIDIPVSHGQTPTCAFSPWFHVGSNGRHERDFVPDCYTCQHACIVDVSHSHVW